MQVPQGQRRSALEICNPGPKQQRNRIGPWHALVRDATSAGAGNGQPSAGAPAGRGDRQRAAGAEVEPLDPNDLDAPQVRRAKFRFLFGKQAPRRFTVAPIERRLHARQHCAVMLTVKPLLRPSRDALDRLTLALVGIVRRQPDVVGSGGQLRGEVQVSAAASVCEKNRNLPGDFTELSQIQLGPDHDILCDGQFPGGPCAAVAQDRHRLLG